MEELVEQTISKMTFNHELQAIKEFYKCTFEHCDFQNAALVDLIFIDCVFKTCNLSNITLKGTQLDHVSFYDCKMLGIQFNECNSFSFYIEAYHTVLDYSSFFERNLKQTKFGHCSMQHVDFERANLHQADFTDCNLLHARFEQSNLEACDFRTSIHIQIDPESNRMKKSKFGQEQLAGLLYKYQLSID